MNHVYAVKFGSPELKKETLELAKTLPTQVILKNRHGRNAYGALIRFRYNQDLEQYEAAIISAVDKKSEAHFEQYQKYKFFEEASILGLKFTIDYQATKIVKNTRNQEQVFCTFLATLKAKRDKVLESKILVPLILGMTHNNFRLFPKSKKEGERSEFTAHFITELDPESVTEDNKETLKSLERPLGSLHAVPFQFRMYNPNYIEVKEGAGEKKVILLDRENTTLADLIFLKDKKGNQFSELDWARPFYYKSPRSGEWYIIGFTESNYIAKGFFAMSEEDQKKVLGLGFLPQDLIEDFSKNYDDYGLFDFNMKKFYEFQKESGFAGGALVAPNWLLTSHFSLYPKSTLGKIKDKLGSKIEIRGSGADPNKVKKIVPLKSNSRLTLLELDKPSLQAPVKRITVPSKDARKLFFAEKSIAGFNQVNLGESISDSALKGVFSKGQELIRSLIQLKKSSGTDEVSSKGFLKSFLGKTKELLGVSDQKEQDDFIWLDPESRNVYDMNLRRIFHYQTVKEFGDGAWKITHSPENQEDFRLSFFGDKLEISGDTDLSIHYGDPLFIQHRKDDSAFYLMGVTTDLELEKKLPKDIIKRIESLKVEYEKKAPDKYKNYSSIFSNMINDLKAESENHRTYMMFFMILKHYDPDSKFFIDFMIDANRLGLDEVLQNVLKEFVIKDSSEVWPPSAASLEKNLKSLYQKLYKNFPTPEERRYRLQLKQVIDAFTQLPLNQKNLASLADLMEKVDKEDEFLLYLMGYSEGTVLLDILKLIVGLDVWRPGDARISMLTEEVNKEIDAITGTKAVTSFNIQPEEFHSTKVSEEYPVLRKESDLPPPITRRFSESSDSSESEDDSSVSSEEVEEESEEDDGEPLPGIPVPSESVWLIDPSFALVSSDRFRQDAFRTIIKGEHREYPSQRIANMNGFELLYIDPPILGDRDAFPDLRAVWGSETGVMRNKIMNKIIETALETPQASAPKRSRPTPPPLSSKPAFVQPADSSRSAALSRPLPSADPLHSSTVYPQAPRSQLPPRPERSLQSGIDPSQGSSQQNLSSGSSAHSAKLSLAGVLSKDEFYAYTPHWVLGPIQAIDSLLGQKEYRINKQESKSINPSLRLYKLLDAIIDIEGYKKITDLEFLLQEDKLKVINHIISDALK